MATALALGIIFDATIIRGVLTPALVAALRPPTGGTTSRVSGPGTDRLFELLASLPGVTRVATQIAMRVLKLDGPQPVRPRPAAQRLAARPGAVG